MPNLVLAAFDCADASLSLRHVEFMTLESGFERLNDGVSLAGERRLTGSIIHFEHVLCASVVCGVALDVGVAEPVVELCEFGEQLVGSQFLVTPRHQGLLFLRHMTSRGKPGT